MSEFNIKFRGVRGSYPIANKDFLQYGGNTSCIEVNVGGHLIILDAGTGLIDTGKELMEKYISSGMSPEERTPVNATVLLSHIHQDHTQGFTFFKPLHLKSTTVNVFGHVSDGKSLKNELASMLFGKSFPLDLGDIAGNLNIHNINDGDTIVLRHNCAPFIIQTNEMPQGDDVLITCHKSYAHPREGVFVYKISYKNKSLVYATDKESYLGGDKKFIEFARNCNLLVHDAQYTTEDYLDLIVPKQGYGHSTFEIAVETQRLANAEKLVFFHFDPDYNDEKLNGINEHYQNQYGGKAIMAYEGLELDLL